MNGLGWRTTTALAVVALAVGVWFVARPASADSSPAYYLALGDSVPVWNGTNSYPYLIASHYAATSPGLQVVDMACSGETTSSMIANSLCAPGPQNSQLDEATAFLQAHQGSTAIITVDIGGNDVVNCATGASLDVSCILNGLTTMQTNMDTILTALREAAGPSVPIVGMNYFDPWLGDWLGGGAEQDFATGTVSELTLFNQTLAGEYGKYDIPVADVASAFDISDLTDQVASPWGEVPVAVDKACTWLDITCSAGQIEGFGDDPDDAGATVIAQTFEQTIGPAITPTTTTTTPTTSTTTPFSSTTTTSSPLMGSGSSGSTETTSPAVTTSSGSLAFTGMGNGSALLGVLGLGAVLAGGLIVVARNAVVRLRRRSGSALK